MHISARVSTQLSDEKGRLDSCCMHADGSGLRSDRGSTEVHTGRGALAVTKPGHSHRNVFVRDGQADRAGRLSRASLAAIYTHSAVAYIYHVSQVYETLSVSATARNETRDPRRLHVRTLWMFLKAVIKGPKHEPSSYSVKGNSTRVIFLHNLLVKGTVHVISV